MALPPTALHRYLSTDPSRCFKSLKRAGLLRRGVEKEKILAAVRAATDHDPGDPPMAGPNALDRMVDALYGDLNEHGQELADTPTHLLPRPHKPFWRRWWDKLTGKD